MQNEKHSLLIYSKENGLLGIEKKKSSYPGQHSKQPKDVWIGTRWSPERPIISQPEALQVLQQLGKSSSVHSLLAQLSDQGVKWPCWYGRQASRPRET